MKVFVGVHIQLNIYIDIFPYIPYLVAPYVFLICPVFYQKVTVGGIMHKDLNYQFAPARKLAQQETLIFQPSIFRGDVSNLLKTTTDSPSTTMIHLKKL